MLELTSVKVEFMLFDQKIKAEIPVKTEPIEEIDFLDVLHPLTDLFVKLSAEKVVKEGKTISCQKGCGACCRQLVPVTESEVYVLHHEVKYMPRYMKNEIRQRFEDAIELLDQKGLLDALEDINELSQQELRELGDAYFKLGIACPFLHEEKCRVHHIRPMACREYLVTSPAVNCSNPQPDTIDVVPLAATVSVAAAQLHEPLHSDYVQQIPLIFALSLADEFPNELEPIDSIEMLRILFSRLAKKQIQDKINEK